MNKKLFDIYKYSFGSAPEKYFSAPCRINIIGEHTDYNSGLALPAAISKYIEAVAGKRNDNIIYLKSLNKAYDVMVDLDNISNDRKFGWGNYPLGIFATLQKRGYKLPHGLNITYTSEVPLGSGLSSSAALLNLTAFIASTIYGLNLSKEEVALLAHQSETEFNGLKCGIMDEFAIALGKKDNCILLNCADNSYIYENISFKELSLVVIVSNITRNLVVSPYNQRVEECNKALNILQSHFDINSLSDLNVSDLAKCKELLSDEILYKRVLHVVSENQRVKDFVEASKNNDLDKMCHLLNESHESLRDNYEVTGEYLDYLHDISLKNGALAERMTGAGFGGSSIALIKKDDFENFVNKVSKEFQSKYKIKPFIFLAEICGGLCFEDL